MGEGAFREERAGSADLLDGENETPLRIETPTAGVERGTENDRTAPFSCRTHPRQKSVRECKRVHERKMARGSTSENRGEVKGLLSPCGLYWAGRADGTEADSHSSEPVVLLRAAIKAVAYPVLVDPLYQLRQFTMHFHRPKRS